MAGNNYFDYLNQTNDAMDREQAVNARAAAERFSNLPGTRSVTEENENKGAFARRLGKLSRYGEKQIKLSDKQIRQNAADYAKFLAGQVSRGERSPIEASDLYADFGLAYNVPGAFSTAEQLGSMAGGLAPEGTVEKFRPFQTFAAKQLGVTLTEDDIRETEEAARVLGKTSPELFSQFLGAKLLSSPEYIRKNPLAFAANLPYNGRYGVGYQSGGSFTGTYRFKPPSTVDYS